MLESVYAACGFTDLNNIMYQLVREALNGAPKSQEGKRGVIEYLPTLIRESPRETEGGTETRWGLMSHSDCNRSTTSSGGPAWLELRHGRD